MIDPINHNREYYAYKKVNTEMGTAANGQEKFALYKDAAGKEEEEDRKKARERDGVVVELSGRQTGKKEADREAVKPEVQPGKEGHRTFSEIRTFLKQLADLFGSFWSGIRQALYDFWNSDSTNAETGETEGDTGEPEEVIEEAAEEESAEAAGAMESGETSEEGAAAGGSGTERTEFLLQKMTLYDGSGQGKVPAALAMKETEEERAQRIRAYVEQMAPGGYVKNSDLLTHYDRSGRLVRLNGADKHRILHGDERDKRYMRP